MSEEEKQALRLKRKQHAFKEGTTKMQSKKELREKEKQRMRNKWASLNSEEQEAQRQRR